MKTKVRLYALASRAIASLLVLSLVSPLVAAESAVPAKSPSELLEQGVYSQDTKGDLDAAMGFYEQVVAQAKVGQAIAAEAQYRLAVCYYKKKDYAKASAAFEKVVKDYPDQKELVARANEYLAGAVDLLPAPWVDGEELQMDVKFQSGFKIGAARYTADLDTLNGKKIWRLSSFLFAGVVQLSQVEVEADSFKPIHCHWKHTMLGDADTTYLPGKAEIKLEGKDDVKTTPLDHIVYDNEECIQLIRRLPLATNYTTTLNILTGLGGGSIIPMGVTVSGIENVKTPAGTFECYKVELSVKQSFWYLHRCASLPGEVRRWRRRGGID